MLETIKLIGIGIILGIANIIPGVSGGTIAVVFNVYDRLVAVITLNVKKILGAWKFWTPLAFGVIIGILGFAKIVSWLYENEPAPTKCFFTGVILGSLPLVFRKTRGQDGSVEKTPPLRAITACVITFLLMIVMAISNPGERELVIAHISPAFFLLLILIGVLAAITMLIPGVSGSFLLLALGVYYAIIHSISDALGGIEGFLRGVYADFQGFLDYFALPFWTLFPFALGVIGGLLAGAALVRVLLSRAPRVTYGAILGLVAGSVAVVFPREGLDSAFRVAVSAASGLVGFALVLLTNRPPHNSKS
jgi:putative membrane protein